MDYFKWTFAGIDLDLEGTGGQECIDFLPHWQRSTETVVITTYAAFLLLYCWPKLQIPLPNESAGKSSKSNGTNNSVKQNGESSSAICQRHHEWNCRQMLLLVHSLIFGIEMGYKLATQSMLWVLNPCHIVTMIQLFILSAPPSPLVTSVFRLHLHMLNGPIIAIVFPVLNTRELPFEKVIYYVQHILIVVIPFFFIRHGRLYSVEAPSDLSWAMASLSLQTLYHFLILQPVGMLTRVNVDNMLCPAISDPFHGRWYRICAVGHQTALILIFGKIVKFIYSNLSRFVDRFLPWMVKDNQQLNERPVRFVEQPLRSNLNRLLENIPEPECSAMDNSDTAAQLQLSEKNGQLKVH